MYLYRSIFKLFVFVILIFGFITDGLSQEQYKKVHREAMRLIADQEAQKAIKLGEDYLNDENQDDKESCFVLAIAYAHTGEMKTANQYLDRSLQLGLPFSRYLAGPRDLLKPLVNSDSFQQRIDDSKPHLVHGPMLSNVTSSQAEFWVRTYEETPVTVFVSKQGRTEVIHSDTVHTRASKDYTAVVSVSGLEADTEYHYGIAVGNKKLGDQAGSERWNFHTYPEPGNPVKMQVGFGGGAGYTPSFKQMWNTLSANWLPAFLLLGDNVYIDHPRYPSVQDYCYYRRQSSTEYRDFISRTSIYAIWDDHDFGGNDSWGTADKYNPEWKFSVWEKYKNNWNNPYFGGGKENPGVWTDFSIGDVDFFMLDGRYYRTSPALEETDMLGEAQKEWLFKQLKQSTATFKVIASPVPWSFGVKNGKQMVYAPAGGTKKVEGVEGKEVPRAFDTWEGYAEEREQIFSFIEENEIEGVILLSADRHRSDAWKIPRENGYDFYEFESSKMTNIHTHPVFSESILGYNEKNSFGLLKFNTVKRDPELTYQIVNIDNEVVNEITLRRSQLEYD